MDDILIQAWPAYKSFVVENDNRDGDGGAKPGEFKGQRRSNDTQESKTGGDAPLYPKADTARKLRYMGCNLGDIRYGLIAKAMARQTDGHAEHEAKAMISFARKALGDDEHQVTLSATKGYFANEFIETCVAMKVTPHVA